MSKSGIFRRGKGKDKDEEIDLADDQDSTTKIFGRHCDDRYQRRRGRSKSIDINAIQGTLKEMGYDVTPAEIFEILKDYQSPTGQPGQVDYDQFKTILCNLRNTKQNDPTLKAAFTSLGATDINDKIDIARIAKSLDILKQCNVDTQKLQVCV